MPLPTALHLFALLALTGTIRGQDQSATPTPEPTDPAPRFVAIALTQTKDGRREASIWDVPVGEPAQRRLVLGDSSWAPTPLDGSVGLLRWQVRPRRADVRHYEVRILRFDAATFSTTDLLRTARARSLGTARGRTIVETSEGQVVIDAASGEVEALAERIEVLARHGDEWLVVRDGKLARFDAARGEVTQRFDKVLAQPRSDRRRTLWSGGRYVVRHGAFFDEQGRRLVALPFGELGIVHQEVRICDLETGAESSVRVRMQARGGSGIGVIPTAMPTELVGGMFRYVERRAAEGAHADLEDFVLERDAQWVTIDVATGRELLRTDYAERDLDTPDPLAAAGVPGYLREAFRAEGLQPDDDNLARVFLRDRGVQLRSFAGACRTPDGQRLLVLADGTLHLCDLKRRTLRRWPAPKEWARQIHLALHAR